LNFTRFDIGEIVRQYRVPIEWSETAKELEHKLSIHGSLMLMECLRDLPRSIQRATPQPDTGVTYGNKFVFAFRNVLGCANGKLSYGKFKKIFIF
jgi:methionyl-tRNA formyltransferase